MFLRSSNVTALVRILSYVMISGISKMAACNRKWINTTNVPQTLTWKGIQISTVGILDAINKDLAVGISLLSCIQAEIYVIPYSLPVTGRHLWFLTHPDWRQCFDQSSRVAWHRKHRYSRWNFVAISRTCWDFMSTSGYMPPSLSPSIHPNKRQCFDQCSRVSWHRKYIYIRMNFVVILNKGEIYVIPYPIQVTGRHLWCIILTLT